MPDAGGAPPGQGTEPPIPIPNLPGIGDGPPPVTPDPRLAGDRAAKKPTQQGGYVETKQPTYPREGRCVGRCVEDTGSLEWWFLLL